MPSRRGRFGPFHDGRNEDAAFEPDLDSGSGRKVWNLISHHSALGDVVNGKVGRRPVDQKLQFSALDRDALEAALFSGRGEGRPLRRWNRLLTIGLCKWHGRSAETAFGSHPTDIPLRPPAAGTTIQFIRTIDDVVTAFRECRRK